MMFLLMRSVVANLLGLSTSLLSSTERAVIFLLSSLVRVQRNQANPEDRCRGQVVNGFCFLGRLNCGVFRVRLLAGRKGASVKELGIVKLVGKV